MVRTIRTAAATFEICAVGDDPAREITRDGVHVIALAAGDVARADAHALTGLTFVALVGLSVAQVQGQGVS